MFPPSRDEEIPRDKATIEIQKIMLIIFFSGVSLIILNSLPSDARFNQEYFTNNILPGIVEARRQIFYRFRRRALFVQMKDYKCHNGCKMTDEFNNLKLERIPHRPYSLDLSPCAFWIFVILK
jgi:hypothetical protein